MAALTEHRAVLVEHLDDEEESLLPLAERHLSAREWNALGDHFMASTPKPKLLFFLGMVLEEADRTERSMILGPLPLPARLLWYAVGRPQYCPQDPPHPPRPPLKALQEALQSVPVGAGAPHGDHLGSHHSVPSPRRSAMNLKHLATGLAALGGAFIVKGVRDIATGLVVFALLLSGHRRALGWAMLAITFAPAGDMMIVLSNDGSPSTAYGVHGLTAAAVAVTAGLLLHERPLPASTPGFAEPASHPAVGAGPGRAFGGLPWLRRGR
ncbi:DUF4267 domain-containing protein [Streptomyces sp. NBC_01210]|uniref:DUF4267 domain-containing protein n=1 Tax=Streptomyces sp. NBC_01210 TaxID=2903774 RepID=UPI002E10D2BE|nr:DUF4267 domain-containing protein [Streptomyces sp. NBC_01210]